MKLLSIAGTLNLLAQNPGTHLGFYFALTGTSVVKRKDAMPYE